ncbi:MAG TPA: Gfo/Idh/MocA family oxidoreductase [Methylococcales bacterium]
MNKTKIGIIGCGVISDIYLKNCCKSDIVSVEAVSDIEISKAQAKAAQYNIPKVLTTEQLLADDEIKIVVNLTIPIAHFDIAMAALKAGKNVYNEKPLTIELDQGKKLLATAKKNNRLVGAAPDTVLGAGIQTARKMIDSGAIGTPTSATAFMMCPGHESWHAAPEFYYQKGGGPMFDMGPYYLTALINLLGPVKSVMAYTGKARQERLITSQPLNGKKIKVDVPTHIAGVMGFENGAIGTIITSFDVIKNSMPPIEVHGTQASLSVPDPNSFGGPVQICSAGTCEWQPVDLCFANSENSRGLGVEDMALALSQHKSPRTDGTIAYHVLEIMHKLHQSDQMGKRIEIESSCQRPEPMPQSGLRA